MSHQLCEGGTSGSHGVLTREQVPIAITTIPLFSSNNYNIKACEYKINGNKFFYTLFTANFLTDFPNQHFLKLKIFEVNYKLTILGRMLL